MLLQFLISNIEYVFFQKHFDSAQFESHREDGLCKLRSDAVPMVFEALPAVTGHKSEHSKQGID